MAMPAESGHGDGSRRGASDVQSPCIPVAGETPGSVLLDISDEVLRLALQQVATSSGYSIVVNPATCALRVATTIEHAATVTDILVVSPTPLASRIALSAMITGSVRAVISADAPRQLTFAIEALHEDRVTAPGSVISAAARIPELTLRQHRVLACLSAGQLRDLILARHLRVSVATVKRELQQMYGLLAATDRLHLAEVARAMGYDGELVKGWLNRADPRPLGGILRGS